MKPLGHLFMLAALDLAHTSEATRPRGSADDDLSRPLSREEIAAAWRRWAEADRGEPRPAGRGLTLPAPRPGG